MIFFFDFMAKLLECGVGKGHAIAAIRQFFSPLPLLKLIDLCVPSSLFVFHHDSSSLWASFQCLTTALVHLYFAGNSRENPRYYALLALLLDLP